MNDQITGPLRAMVPAIAAWAVARGWLPASLQGSTADFVIAVGTFGAAAWSWYSNRPAAHVAAVAAMPGTLVSDTGNNITIVKRELATVAKENATNAAGR